MTADEIHDQNMKEFADALGECAEALEKPQLEFYSGVVWEYENELLPLRKLAEESEDIGETFDAYKEYDERFDVLLEGMFEQVKTEAALLDAAPELLRVLEELTEWACTYTSPLDENSPHDLLIKARTAIAEAKSVPVALEKPRKPFRPSNGTHGEIFEGAFCERCVKKQGCMIRLLTRCHQETDPEYPKEWVYGDDGQPTCTAFEATAG